MLILFLFYTIILELAYILLSPILFAWLRRKPDAERLAVKYPKKDFAVLVHAASVGEVNGIRQLLLELLNSHPQMRMILTTNTKTARQTAKDWHDRLEVVLSPVDVFHLRQKQLLWNRPQLILVAETEIWPSLLLSAKLERVPVIYVNARMSDKTFKRYKQFGSLLRWAGSSVKAVCAQSEKDCGKFAQVFKTECINAGNLKFSLNQPLFEKDSLRKEWGYQQKDKIVVMGSSRPGEEELMLKTYDALKSEFPDLKLILAPRHPDRVDEIRKKLEGRDASFQSVREPVKDIHIIDVMGQLLPAYALADVCLIGGSFLPFGGHNPLEAAYYGKVIIMGLHHESCQASVKKLSKAEAIIISDANKLTADLKKVLSDPDIFTAMGERARQALAANRDSLPKHLEKINQYLD